MFRIEYNLPKKLYDERLAKLTEEQRAKINEDIGRANLAVLRRRRKPVINTGDVFALSMDGELFFFGKVLNANIRHDTDSWTNGCHLIIIYKKASYKKDISEFEGGEENILIGPEILTRQYWTGGWFETIGNIPLTQEEENLDYGFFHYDVIGQGGEFIKENGTPMDHLPKHVCVYGICCLSAIYQFLRREIIIAPSLVDIKK